MYDYFIQAQIQHIQNQAVQQNYQTLLNSMDKQAQMSYDTQYACCDAYHLQNQPEPIRCCVLGGFNASLR